MTLKEAMPPLQQKTDHVLKVAHITPTNGGVANSARRLHQGLAQAGVNSQLFAPNASADSQYTQPHAHRLLAYASRRNQLCSPLT